MKSRKTLPLILLFAGTVSAQDLSGIGNVVIRLLCILYGIVPWILTLLFIFAGVLVVTGSPENRDHAKKVMINAIVGVIILFLVTFLLTLIAEGLEFSDFNECWTGGEGPVYTTTTLPENLPPTAVAWVDSVSPPAARKSVMIDLGEMVYFDGSDSSDPDGFITSYQWSFGDGESATGPSASHLYGEGGVYSAQLQVVDDDFGMDTDVVEVTVIVLLTVEILKPEDDGDETNCPYPVVWEGEVSGGLPPYRITWRVDGRLLIFYVSDAAITIEETSVEFTPPIALINIGIHDIRLEAEDSLGATASDQKNDIDVITCPLHVEILEPENDWVSLDCPATLSGRVSGGSLPYDITWKADSTVLGTGTITTNGGENTLTFSPPDLIPSGTYDITLEAEDQVGATNDDKKEGINIEECSEPFVLVFVPMGFTETEFATFESIGQTALAYFLARAPFKDCTDPDARIEAYYIHPDDCPDTQSGCSDHCSDCITTARNCVISAGYGGIYDKFAAITKDGGWSGGCACGIPCDGESTSSAYYYVHSHELGHTLGLGHIDCGVDCHACPPFANNPNCPDCSESASETQLMIMDYCDPMQQYGPAGYDYLKTSSDLSPYLGGC